MIDSDPRFYKREHDIMEGLTEEQHNLLFDLVFRPEQHKYGGGRHPFFAFGSKDNQSFEAFPSGTDHGHSIIDELIEKNNLMNVLKDPEVLAYIYGGTQDSLFPYSGEPRDAMFSPQTHSFESYDERNPMNLSKLDILRASYGSEADKEIGALQKLLNNMSFPLNQAKEGR